MLEWVILLTFRGKSKGVTKSAMGYINTKGFIVHVKPKDVDPAFQGFKVFSSHIEALDCIKRMNLNGLRTTATAYPHRENSVDYPRKDKSVVKEGYLIKNYLNNLKCCLMMQGGETCENILLSASTKPKSVPLSPRLVQRELALTSVSKRRTRKSKNGTPKRKRKSVSAT